MAEPDSGEFVLGIDLGTNSLGWSIIGLVDGEPANLIRAGVRVFDAGMEGDIESGQEQSKNLKRREARLHRRQLWRRARRLTKTFNLLRKFALLPSGDASTREQRQDFINNLDQTIRGSDWFKAKASAGAYPEPDQTLPYILRAAALDEPLEPNFFGRAVYHLAQRRGFLSNRVRSTKKDDDEGAVKKGIGELRKAMEESHARTLGEYFAHASPCESRIRGRWTARSMYEEEFQKIWASQASHNPTIFTDERKKQITQALFFQRPLWFDANVIGHCELEPEERRAPAYSLRAQRFRLLQTVNNLRVLPPGQPERDLSPDERKKLIDDLEAKGDQTFAQLRKWPGFKKCEFNLERGGEKRLMGNRTSADFQAAFGDYWAKMSPEERESAVEYVHAFQRPDKLARAASKKWGLNAEAAETLAGILLEPDYLSLSRKAIKRLLPLLEEGVPYATARRQLYPERFQAGAPLPLLPPVEQALTEIRNPAVKRSLTELRKVVNAVIRAYGKPLQVRVELARDLKKSKKQRQALTEVMRKNERERTAAAKRIIAEAGVSAPKPDDIRKFSLSEECRWQCPYTGRSISMGALFGPEAQFDIEHIIPFDRSLDNSFTNLTLCYHEENRNVKRGRTPFQAYHDTERYDQILDRVARFTGERRMAAAKLARFKMNDEQLGIFLEDFRNRQLNDTAYASSLAAGYLGLLYGGVNDAAGNHCVQATSGQTTAYFRSLWKLNSILNDGPSTDGGRIAKSRADHRHHAVDAVVIGLTDAAMVKRLSDAAERAPSAGHKHFASLEGPWPNFVDTVRAGIGCIIASHRVSKKVSGALHEETIYSRFDPKAPTGNPSREPRLRQWVNELSAKDVENIADEGVKSRVREKLAEVGGDPGKISDPKDPANIQKLPYMIAKQDGRHIPIKRVRVKVRVQPVAIGKGPKQRFVKLGSNHHIEVYSGPDRRGREQWKGDVVSMFGAYLRLKNRKLVINPEGKGNLVFSLGPGESVRFEDGPFKDQLFVVRGVTQEGGGRVFLVPINDARKKEEIVKSKLYRREFVNTLREWKTHKVVISPLGEVSEAHD